jgi:hypothetical protein
MSSRGSLGLSSFGSLGMSGFGARRVSDTPDRTRLQGSG